MIKSDTQFDSKKEPKSKKHQCICLATPITRSLNIFYNVIAIGLNCCVFYSSNVR